MTEQPDANKIRERTEKFLEAAKDGRFDAPSSPEKKPSRYSDYLKATIMIGFVFAGMLGLGGWSLFNIARRLDEKVPVTFEKPQPLSPGTVWFLEAFDAYPWVGVLLVLMLADILTGLLAAVVLKQISSKVSWSGMAKKATMLILVGCSAVIEGQAAGLPLAKLVASVFSIHELISVTENASRSGIIIPKPLADFITGVLQKPIKPEPVHIDKVEKVEVHQHIEPPK